MTIATIDMARYAGENTADKEGLIFDANSPLAETRRLCRRIGASEATVLLSGETGTGKEVFARFIHDQSQRASAPFVPVNCAAIPESLIESELFGYVKGAFTGAESARRGRVAMAEGGTLFLDEIGELPLNLQVKLLRLLQEKNYEPVGSSETESSDFRLIVATNKDLAQEVREGKFRADLYYRLFVCPVQLPPLRERRCDIVHLFAYFWARHKEKRPLTTETLRAIEAHDYPGNVRELENLVERVSVCAAGKIIELGDLPAAYQNAAPMELTPAPEIAESQYQSAFTPEVSLPSGALELPIDLHTMLRDLEKVYIDAALLKTKSNKKEAAKLLGMGRTTLVEKIRRRQSADCN